MKTTLAAGVAAIALVAGVTAWLVVTSSNSTSADDGAIFCSEYVPLLQASSLYAKWAASYKGERDQWLAFSSAICAGQSPPSPALVSSFGKSLIAAGKMALPEVPAATSTTTTITSTTTTTTPPLPGNVPPSIAADCSVDVTATLLYWIASMPNGSTLSFGSGCYRIEGTLVLRNRSGLVLDGGTFRSLNFPDGESAIWRVFNSSGIVFRNMTIHGSFTQTNPPHIVETLQHAHAIDLRGTSAEIDHLTASNLAGDCVYFGLGVGKKSSGSYHDSSCQNVSRNAVSVTAGQNITISNIVTSGIGFIPFDIEPNATAGSGASNIVVRDNTIGSFYLYAFGVSGDNVVDGVSFLGNHVSYSGAGGQVGIGINTRGRRYSNVTISGTVTSVTQAGNAIDAQRTDGLVVTNNATPVTGVMLLCSDVSALTFSGNTPQTQSGCPG
jgi:hypothetical protein